MREQKKSVMIWKIKRSRILSKIAIAGTGYVGLSNAVLLAQHNDVVAVDVIEEKVNMINNKKSPRNSGIPYRKEIKFKSYTRW